MSPSIPPSAAKTLLDANESNIVFANEVLVKLGLINVTLVSSTAVNTPASTLDAAPPPVKNLTVNVVL